MTTRRAHNAFRKMRSGSIGGQSRVATPVSPSSFVRPVGNGVPPGEPDPGPTVLGRLYAVLASSSGDIYTSLISSAAGLSWTLLRSGLSDPVNNWAPADGIIYEDLLYIGYSSFGQGRIDVIDASSGVTVDTWFAGDLNDPETLVMGEDGLLYIADRDNDGPIYRTSITSPSLSLWANSESDGHWAPIFVDGRMFINDNWSQNLLEVSPSGVVVHFAGVEVGGLCTDGTYIYFTSTGPGDAIYRFNPSDNSFSLTLDLNAVLGSVSVRDDIAFAGSRLYVYGSTDGDNIFVSCETDGSDARSEGSFTAGTVQGIVAG